jgi:hypothetical protein
MKSARKAVLRQMMDWRAAIIAGIIAGMVYLVMKMRFVPQRILGLSASDAVPFVHRILRAAYGKRPKRIHCRRAAICVSLFNSKRATVALPTAVMPLIFPLSASA